MFLARRVRVVNPEAEAAAKAAKKALKHVRARGEEVRKVSEASREFRRKNHFAEDLQLLFYPERRL